MIIKTSRENLLEPLLQIAGVVERRQTLPILSNVLFQCQPKQIVLTATDLEVELKTQAQCECDGSLDFTLPARKLLDICKALPDGAKLSLTVENNERAVLKSGRGRYALGLLPAVDYPVIETTHSSFSFGLEQQQLKELISNTGFAMAQQDVRYYLNGMLLEITPQRVRAVATDGHRLALSDIDGLNISDVQEQKFILPRKAALELGRLLNDTDAPVQVELSTNHVRFVMNNTTFTSKLIDGRFPDYERVIPAPGKNVLTVERDLLKQALQRASILSNEKYRGIRFTLSENLLQLTANNPEQEQAEEEVAVDYAGDAMSIGFNVSYLLDVLNTIDASKITMLLTDPNSSSIVTADNSQQSRYVIMPMRL